MAQTFYIESDEEIISLVSRLRQSFDEENVFVFPKRSLVLQSIINLRLLEREATKSRKKIVIVTQDEAGRMLAEKAGIETRDYAENSINQNSHNEHPLEEVPQEKISPERQHNISLSPSESTQPLISSDVIGSTTFNVQKEPNNIIKNASIAPFSSFISEGGQKESKKISIRNASPEMLTCLNSQRTETKISQDIVRNPTVSTMTPSAFQNNKNSVPSVQNKPVQVQSSVAPRQEYTNKLKNFYADTRVESKIQKRPPVKTVQKPVTVNNKNARIFFFLLGGISLLLIVFVVLFFVLPKAEISVTPYKKIQISEKEFSGKIGDDANNDVALRLLEDEREVSVTVPTTGKSEGKDQKSYGTVTLYNTFSTEEQSLVATTRLESSDGKIFRLESGVTVPGMKNVDGKQVPGEVTAQVVADQSGKEYNIEASRFSIPGFKGSQKYEKFYALSTKSMIGGGESGISDTAVIAKIDQETALREAMNKAKELFLSNVQEKIDASEKILEENIEVTPLVPPTFPSVGTVANMIEYKGVFTIKAVAFSEKNVREKIESLFIQNNLKKKIQPISSIITYDDSLVDFTSGTVRIKASARVTAESVIDSEKLRNMVAGKSIGEIQEIMKEMTEVKSIRIDLFPAEFVKRVPKSLDKISVTLDPAEEEK